MIYVLCLLLLALGIFGVLTQKNLIKIVISISIIEYAVNVFLVLVGYRTGGYAPIVVGAADASGFAGGAVDPLPQAMVLTSIVIGLGTTALLVVLALRLYHRYGTYDITEIRKLRG